MSWQQFNMQNIHGSIIYLSTRAHNECLWKPLYIINNSYIIYIYLYIHNSILIVLVCICNNIDIIIFVRQLIMAIIKRQYRYIVFNIFGHMLWKEIYQFYACSQLFFFLYFLWLVLWWLLILRYTMFRFYIEFANFHLNLIFSYNSKYIFRTLSALQYLYIFIIHILVSVYFEFHFQKLIKVSIYRTLKIFRKHSYKISHRRLW